MEIIKTVETAEKIIIFFVSIYPFNFDELSGINLRVATLVGGRKLKLLKLHNNI